MRRFLLVFCITMSTCLVGCASASDAQNKTNQNGKSGSNAHGNEEQRIELVINDVSIKVEYADTPSKRQLGLMYRRSLCDDCGMLFKFDSVRIGSIWMKNTFIPLDLAYISEDGEIIDIRQLQPHDLTPVTSSKKVLYALEMNKGWFASKDIREGDIVKQLP